MSVTPFRPIQGRRIFEEILDQLEQAILDGHISAGDRLPSERQLAEQFNASRTSVREAVRVLEALGVAKVKPGAENGAVLVEKPDDALRLLLRFQLALRHISIASVIEFRTVLEPWSARAASERATDDAISRMQAVLVAMGNPIVGPAEFHQLDATFHIEIARAAQNDLVVLVLDGARTSIERIMLDALSRVPDWPATRVRIRDEHAQIVNAIAKRRAEDAETLMKRHIRSFYDEIGL
ncbi:MAG: FadR family transcriptional regulator [Gaiellaceae bacterium MAG52_C11]|nr:FadR family transcriptional regulator [Candidatus Gaiellasilicea maunaloa]